MAIMHQNHCAARISGHFMAIEYNQKGIASKMQINQDFSLSLERRQRVDRQNPGPRNQDQQKNSVGKII